jgi:signal transduction histidine kinase
MFQEVLQNILKHAKATEINIEVSDIQEVFKIKVTDNGIGFIVKTVPNNNNSTTKGIGLINMTNRAKLIGGSLLIESELGKGTCITLQMPIADEENI